MDSFLLIVISIIGLLTIASYSSIIAKKFGFPYTILLFLIGVFLVSAKNYIPSLHLFTNLELSKDLVFFIFLPTIIFESAYNMSYQKVLRDIIPITGLAVFSLFLSTLLIGVGFKFILGLLGFDIPYLASFLFGAIISATDPVAVLAIFKEFGVPKRLMYLFEGESLMNDGTAVALFFILLGMIDAGTSITASQIGIGFLSFLSMLFGGVFFGVLMGVLFSKMIQWVKHSWAELTLTLIMAHTTFILAELISNHFSVFKLSAIIATTLAALTLGNYGRYKISKNVREMMDTTWGYFAFISNSLIFLLMGMMIGDRNFHISELFIPISVAIVVVMIARAVSVFGVLTPLNFFIKFPISFSWQKLLAWGSLRGAIAITMLLFIPESFTLPGWSLKMSVREFLSVVVISCIVFTLIIKTFSIKKIIEKMGMVRLSRMEEFTFHQIKEIVDQSIIKRLLKIEEKRYVPEKVSTTLLEKYEQDDEYEKEEIQKCVLRKNEFESLLRRYALGIERRSILEAFESKEVDERTLKRMLNKIEYQYGRLEIGVSQLKTEKEKQNYYERFKEFLYELLYYRSKEQKMLRDYMFYRARAIVSGSVLNQLKGFQKDFYSDCNDAFRVVIKQYEKWHDEASQKIYALEDTMRNSVYREETKLLNNHLLFLEKELLEVLYSKHIMTGKVYRKLKHVLWDEE